MAGSADFWKQGKEQLLHSGMEPRDGFSVPPSPFVPLQPIELSGFFFSSARISSTRLSGDFGVLNTVSGLDQVEQVPLHGGPVDFRTGYRTPGMTEKMQHQSREGGGIHVQDPGRAGSGAQTAA